MLFSGRILNRQIFLIGLVLVAKSALLFAAPPKWLLHTENVFPSEAYIHVVGDGASADEAKRSALAELSAYFSQTVKTETAAVSSLYDNGEKVGKKQVLNQKVKITSQAELFSVHYTETFHDKKAHSYSVCAYINRDEAWAVITQKIEICEQIFLHEMAQADSEADALRKIILLNRAVSGKSDFDKLYQYALAIYPKKCGNFTEFSSKISKAEQTLFSLKQENPIFLSVNGDESAQIQAKLSEILAQNGFVLSKNGAYKMTVTVFAHRTEQNGIFSCTPSITATVTGKHGTVASFSGTTEKVAAYNEPTARRITAAKLEELLDERFMAECFQ